MEPKVRRNCRRLWLHKGSKTVATITWGKIPIPAPRYTQGENMEAHALLRRPLNGILNHPPNNPLFTTKRTKSCRRWTTVSAWISLTRSLRRTKRCFCASKESNQTTMRPNFCKRPMQVNSISNGLWDTQMESQRKIHSFKVTSFKRHFPRRNFKLYKRWTAYHTEIEH